MNFSDFGFSILAGWIANKLGGFTRNNKTLLLREGAKSRNQKEEKPIQLQTLKDKITPHLEIDELAKRVLLIYEKHGIATTQIPRITPDKYGVTLSVLSNQEVFLSRLTPKYLEWVSTTFGVCHDWIEKGDPLQIYPSFNYYKNEYELIRWVFEKREKKIF